MVLHQSHFREFLVMKRINTDTSITTSCRSLKDITVEIKKALGAPGSSVGQLHVHVGGREKDPACIL